jgi:thiamine biosynthesis lipoprotein
MMKMLSRRRFISISAVASASAIAGSLASGSRVFANTNNKPVRWQGIAMGAKAELILDHPDHGKARSVIYQLEAEIRRLEKIFSLYDASSAVTELNQAGALTLPPIDLVRCLGDANQHSQITGGAFDISVQPLWELYARHFANSPNDIKGPDNGEIATARELVNYKAIRFDSQEVSFAKPGMKITLNGIAQGYMTDRIAELLKSSGFENVMIDIGEIRGLGHRADGNDWIVGIKAPDGSGRLTEKVPLRDQAMATSGSYGSRFSNDGIHHHLFDPKLGQSAQIWDSISVIAETATKADALSTAFSSMTEERIRKVASKQNVSVIASRGKTTARL